MSVYKAAFFAYHPRIGSSVFEDAVNFRFSTARSECGVYEPRRACQDG
jgi:hypothetical protein